MQKPNKFKNKKQKGNSVFKIPRLYDDPKWVKYSQSFLKLNPLCYACGKKSEVTDHWTAHKNDKELFWKTDNLIPLCAQCHNTVTPLFDRFNPPKTQEKLIWVNQKRLLHGLVFRVKVLPLD